MAIKEKTSADHLDTAYGDRMQKSVDHILEYSKVKSNGVRELPKGAYIDALKEHGVTKEEIDRVNNAIDFENTAAARVALLDVEGKITAATKEELEDKDFRRNLSSTVRLPTFGGATEVSVTAEKFNNIPFRGEGDEGPSQKASYGVLRTSINTKGRIHKDFHTEADERMRKALGIN